ncbi:hypothetical protein ACF09I_34885 [Streptomyces sp. NPDC014940]|uniref:hypothetical protein n=1 Tax=Streptomyces sp. NPDC014940 TaxID=3364932 RepID=UPI003701A0E2
MSVCLVEDVSDGTYVLDSLAVTLTPALPWLGHQVCWETNGRLKESVDLTRVTCDINEIRAGEDAAHTGADRDRAGRACRTRPCTRRGSDGNVGTRGPQSSI